MSKICLDCGNIILSDSTKRCEICFEFCMKNIKKKMLISRMNNFGDITLRKWAFIRSTDKTKWYIEFLIV